MSERYPLRSATLDGVECDAIAWITTDRIDVTTESDWVGGRGQSFVDGLSHMDGVATGLALARLLDSVGSTMEYLGVVIDAGGNRRPLTPEVVRVVSLQLQPDAVVRVEFVGARAPSIASEHAAVENKGNTEQ